MRRRPGCHPPGWRRNRSSSARVEQWSASAIPASGRATSPSSAAWAADAQSSHRRVRIDGSGSRAARRASAAASCCVRGPAAAAAAEGSRGVATQPASTAASSSVPRRIAGAVASRTRMRPGCPGTCSIAGEGFLCTGMAPGKAAGWEPEFTGPWPLPRQRDGPACAVHACGARAPAPPTGRAPPGLRCGSLQLPPRHAGHLGPDAHRARTAYPVTRQLRRLTAPAPPVSVA